jgi:hypothetical protein
MDPDADRRAHSEQTPNAFSSMAVLTAVAVGVGAWALDPLPPTFTPLWVVPPVLGGLYLAVAAAFIRDQGLYGALFGHAPRAVHVGLCALGFALLGGGCLALLKLPPAGAVAVVHGGSALDGFCRADADERLERDLLPTVEALIELRPGQGRALIQTLDGQIRALAERCLPSLRAAFEDPRGTHVSWVRWRDLLVEHPTYRPTPATDPLWTAPHRPRSLTPSERVRPVVLEFDQGEQPVVVE